jgi:hypothetical protein
MRGQINDTARLRGNGKTLQVTGWLEFDDDEKSTVVLVTVTQGGSTVIGPSGNTPSIKKFWAAEVDGNDTFQPGPAHAEATATVYVQNGPPEQYPEPGKPPWAKDITLLA